MTATIDRPLVGVILPRTAEGAVRASAYVTGPAPCDVLTGRSTITVVFAPVPKADAELFDPRD